MWFSILKLNLGNLTAQIQGDVEGENINVQGKKTCEEKYYRFIQNIYDEFGDDPWFNYSISNANGWEQIPEELFCLLIENLDKFFRGSEPTPQSAVLKNWRNRDQYLMKFGPFQYNTYSLDIDGIIAKGFNSPFVITLRGPFLVKVKQPKKVGFEDIYSKEHAKKTYDKIKSCWERA